MLDALFLMFLGRIGSLNGLDQTRPSTFWSRRLGCRLPSADTLGRVMTGAGGDIILRRAKEVLRAEFPACASRIALIVPGEKEKRHGQAIAAASLPIREEPV